MSRVKHSLGDGPLVVLSDILLSRQTTIKQKPRGPEVTLGPSPRGPSPSRSTRGFLFVPREPLVPLEETMERNVWSMRIDG